MYFVLLNELVREIDTWTRFCRVCRLTLADNPIEDRPELGHSDFHLLRHKRWSEKTPNPMSMNQFHHCVTHWSGQLPEEILETGVNLALVQFYLQPRHIRHLV